MAPPASRLFDLTEAVLHAVTNRIDGLPGRQFVSAGAPAWDCELVAAWCERTFGQEGNPAVQVTQQMIGGAGHAMRSGVFVVTIVRCTPAVPDQAGDQVILPSVAEEETAARTLYGDAQATLNALVAAERSGDLGGCHGLAFGDWRVVGPDGGMVAGELRVFLSLTAGP